MNQLRPRLSFGRRKGTLKKSKKHTLKNKCRHFYSSFFALAILASLINAYLPVFAQSYPEALVSKLQGANIPGQITYYETPNSWGTVIYLPQIHLNPGSQPEDASNDTAVAAQNQIYSIISYLTQNLPVDFAMAEGDLYGEVPRDKIQLIQKQIAAREALEAHSQKLEQLLSREPLLSFEGIPLARALKQAAEEIDRNVILKGAPYKFLAEGHRLTLYGAENEKTLNAGAEAVRQYLYLEDRLNSLENAGRVYSSAGATAVSANSLPLEIINLFKNQNRYPLSRILDSLEETASLIKKNDIVNECQAIKVVLADFKTDSRTEKPANLPQRSDNPYNFLTDKAAVKKLLDDNSREIQKVVIDQRNSETAENFAQALKSLNRNLGILEFGAGHKDGLIPELQARGLSVIVITANEVANTPPDDRSGNVPKTSSGNPSIGETSPWSVWLKSKLAPQH